MTRPAPTVTVPVDLISRALEEFRMIRMKDSDAVYDTTLRLDLQLALSAAPAAPQAAGVDGAVARAIAALERDQFCAGTTLRHQDVRCLLSALRAQPQARSGEGQ